MPYFLGRKESLDDITEYKELSDSEEESLSEQEDSEMQEFIHLAMTETRRTLIMEKYLTTKKYEETKR
jgi:hypothetical protein